MLQLPFYAPDQAFANNKIGASDHIVNLYPLADGYRSVPDFIRTSSDSLKGKVIGSIAFVLSNDAEDHVTIIGTTKGLFKTIPDSTGIGVSFVDISRDSGYSLVDSDFWSFTLFGNHVIAINKNYPAQILDINNIETSKFKDLNEAPRGTHIKVWGNHLVVIGVLNIESGYRNTVAWSGLNDPYNWKFTDTASDADQQQFFDGGKVLNATSSKHPLIFTRNKIYRGNYIPSSALIFTFEDISDRIDLKGINSVIEVNDSVYFYSDKGFYQIDSRNNIVNIGESILNNYISREFSSSSLINMIVSKDFSSTRIFWGLSKVFGSGIYDYILVYDYELNKWTTIDRAIQYFINYTNLGRTLDSLDSIGTLDSLPYSLDSSVWQEHNMIVGAIDRDGYLVTMSGKQMESSIRTGVISNNNNGFITMTSASLDADINNYTIDLLYSDKKTMDYNYDQFYTQYKIPVSRYRDEAIFNIRTKYVKIQFNLTVSNKPYSLYTFTYRTIENGYM